MTSLWQALWSVLTTKKPRREQRKKIVRETACCTIFGFYMILILLQLLTATPTCKTHLLSNQPKLPDSDPQKKVARIRHETQIHILNLLITSLALKAPNLALYLLGYDVKKPVSSTNLQDPGQTTAVIVVYFVKGMNF